MSWFGDIASSSVKTPPPVVTVPDACATTLSSMSLATSETTAEWGNVPRMPALTLTCW